MITDVQDDDDVIDNVDDKDGGDDDDDDQDEKEDDHHEEHHWLVVVDALGWVGEHGNIANWFIIKTGPHLFGRDDDGDDDDDNDNGDKMIKCLKKGFKKETFRADPPSSFQALHYNLEHEFQNWKIGVFISSEKYWIARKKLCTFLTRWNSRLKPLTLILDYFCAEQSFIWFNFNIVSYFVQNA